MSTLKSKKTILFLILSLAVAGLGTVFAYYYFNQPAIDPRTNLDPATSEQKKAGEDTKERFTEDPKVSEQPDNAEKIEIVRAYHDTSIGKVVVQTKLPGSSWASCTLTLLMDGKTIEKKVDAIYQPDYSTCAGFSIERSEFSESGTWQIVLNAYKVGGQQSQVKDSVTIE